MSDDQPFRAEYSKSNRASCKGCKEKIEKEVLRLAAMVQSHQFDAKIPNWYHFKCFFQKQKPACVGDIAHFEQLRWEDQEKITKKIESPDVVDSGKKKTSDLKEFTLEYSPNARAGCKVCEEKVKKGEIRIAKKDYDSDSARRFGPLNRWHHIDCFIKIRQDLEYFEGGEKLPGFFTLSKEDQDLVKNKIRKIDPGQKRKADEQKGDVAKKPKIDSEAQKKMKEQNDRMFKFRDFLKKHFNKTQLQALLEENDYDIPAGIERILDTLSDGMAFGALLKCDVCTGGQLVFQSGVGYKCTGALTEWTSCQVITKTPKRKEFIIPLEEKEENSFLNKYKCKIQDRIVTTTATQSQNGSAASSSSSSSSSKSSTASTSKSSKKPLDGFKFVLSGEIPEKDVEKSLKSLGARVSTSVSKNIAAVISTKESFEAMDGVIKKAKKHGIQVLPLEFLDEVKNGGAIMLINKMNMADWGEDPLGRLIDPDKQVMKSGASLYNSKSGNEFLKSVPDKVKVRLKGGAAVDPESGLDDEAHVVKHKGKLMTAVLCSVDAAKGTNSYYKLQALEADRGNSYWVYRSWGRIGTTIGNNKTEEFDSKEECIQHFKGLFEEKTRNKWGAEPFQKFPHAFYPMDIDFGQEEDKVMDLSKAMKSSKSKLPISVQELICLIFDVDRMKKALVEFEIDLKKMPLGKLSKRQIEKAYKVLTEAQQTLASKEDSEAKPGKLLDCSNRFYTLIPHDFGMNKAPLLDNEEYITSKVEMLDNLLEIEIAYNLLKSEDKEITDPIDSNYNKLNTKLEPLTKSDVEYTVIEEYVKNTHAATHSHYKLKLQNVFKVDRKGEKKKFKAFREMENRQLLWHGSRLTNYAGILSQGLRIAPPEAPVTGYMFGKGIYFADMVSKSANYCMTNRTNPTGLLLLGDVALGNMYERTQADYIEKLPSGKHSTKGLGRTHPDPSNTKVLNGAKVPLGKPVPSEVQNTSLLYNEYIVYDISQVNLKYLLQVEFKY